MEEGSLRWQLKHRPPYSPNGLSIKEIIRLFAQIAQAIDFIHQRSIIHRDLKPENVVLARRDGILETYLTDFGIARVLAGTQSFYTQTVTGTFRYMAPEVWDPRLKKTAAVDIYAFGVMLFEALEGFPPFVAEYPAIIQQHVYGEIPQPERTLKEFGPQAAQVILRPLAKKAADRPKTAVSIIEELKSCIPGIEMIGEQFGSYRIISFLGASAYGQTYKAQDERTGDRVAIKIVPYVHPIQELEIYQKLAPQLGILSLRDSGTQDGKHYLVTDYASGGNLRQLLNRAADKPDVQTILDLFRSIAGGIDRLHQMKIVHRDLKPENIVLRETEHGLEPCITDFGISRALSQTQSFYTSTVAGTSYYTAPEAWTPGARQTYAVDIYALGIMLYEALEGDLPFKAEYPAIGLQHLSAEVPYPTKIAAQGGPRAVNALLEALAKDPTDRPKSAVALVEEIFQAYAHYKPRALPFGIDAFFSRLGNIFHGRKRIAALAAGILLLAVFSATAWANWASILPSPQPTATETRPASLTGPTSVFLYPATATGPAPVLPVTAQTEAPAPANTQTPTTLTPLVLSTLTGTPISGNTITSTTLPGHNATSTPHLQNTVAPSPVNTLPPPPRPPATATQAPPQVTQPPATEAPPATQPPPPPPPPPTREPGKPPTKTPKPK